MFFFSLGSYVSGLLCRPPLLCVQDGIKVAEFKVLTRLSELDTADDSQGDDDDVRMTFTECIDLLESHGAKTSKEVVTEFFSRKMFEKFQVRCYCWFQWYCWWLLHAAAWCLC